MKIDEMCDGDDNCDDGSDENKARCKDNKCGDGYMKCSDDLQCIDKEAMCDGSNNCIDGSDEGEANCKDHTCVKGYVKCSENLLCMPERYICDGENDCADGSDENEASCKERNKEQDTSNSESSEAGELKPTLLILAPFFARFEV